MSVSLDTMQSVEMLSIIIKSVSLDNNLSKQSRVLIEHAGKLLVMIENDLSVAQASTASG